MHIVIGFAHETGRGPHSGAKRMRAARTKREVRTCQDLAKSAAPVKALVADNDAAVGQDKLAQTTPLEAALPEERLRRTRSSWCDCHKDHHPRCDSFTLINTNMGDHLEVQFSSTLQTKTRL